MHPDLCGFVSAAVYEGRLQSAAGTEIQSLLLDCEGDPEALAPAGLRFVDVESVGCTQRSRPEAERLDRTYRAQLGQKGRDKKDQERVNGADDSLVVDPSHKQVVPQQERTTVGIGKGVSVRSCL